MRDRIFYGICFGFVFGVLLRSFVKVDLYFVFLIGVITIALLFFLALRSLGEGGPLNNNKWGIIATIFILAFLLGIFRFHFVDVSANKKAEVLAGSVRQRINLSGKIIDEPDVRENSKKLLVETEKEKILISTNLIDEYKYGDEINFTGKLEKPENFTTDQGKEFDYVNYLRKDGIFYLMNYPKIEILSRGHGNKVKSALFYIKEKFLEKINLSIRGPENLLMGGLILGEKSSFSQELRQSFVNTGTIHIVALSGYNVTIVAEWIMKLFSFLPLTFGIGVGVFAILLFILMTGASTTAIRAGVMAILALIARAMGRNYDVARALILAGVFMIIWNPYILVYDVSFQLSFLATVAVIFLAPRIEKYFTWVTKKFQLRDIVSVTSAAYIFVFPFILYKMGNLSLVALPTNALILPFISFIMLLGFITGFLGLVWYPLAVPIGFISYIFLHYEILIVNFFSNLPFASFSIPNFPLILTIIIYAYFIYRLFGKNIKNFFFISKGK